MPSDERWKEISSLYAAAVERPPEERAAFLTEKCAGDSELRQEIESLLACHSDAQHLLSAPAAQMMAASLAADRVPLVGRRLGVYRIDAPLASGGMGEVYRATDTRLGRAVAVKILPEHLRQDRALRDRFEREARAAAALRHPHVCVLYDVGDADGIDFLVMELLDGDTLAQRLTHGALPVDEALERALEIADALTAIHRCGIVHRDLKPGNIMLTDTGAKLLDFGLATLPAADASDPLDVGAPRVPDSPGSARVSPWSSAAGTLPYMTPEQLNGGTVDHRSDIFAFGAVLYEMVAGRKAFDAADRGTVMRLIREGQPPPLPAAIVASAPTVNDIIERCLRKVPSDRWIDAAALGEALRRARPQSSRPPPPRSLRRWSLGAAGAVATLGLLIGNFGAAGDSTGATGSLPLVVDSARPLTAAEETEMDPAFSPGGDTVAYATGRGLALRIVLRDIASGRTRGLVPGPGAQFQPRWSPDGLRLLYLRRDGLFVTSLDGTSTQMVASASARRGAYTTVIPGGQVITGAAWSPRGDAIAVAYGGALYRVDLDSNEHRHIVTATDELHWCDWSPDPNWIACTSGNPHVPYFGQYLGNIAPSAIVVIPAAGGAVVEIAPRTSMNRSPIWSADGRRLFFISDRQGTSDIYAADIAGDGRPANPPVRMTTGLGAHSIAMSRQRTRLAYTVVAPRSNLWSIPIPTTGPPVDISAARQLTTGHQKIESMYVTRDHQWLVYDSDLYGNSDIFRMPLDGGEPRRLTTHPSGDFAPRVSDDGRWLAYFSWRTQSRDVFVQPFDGGPEQQVTATTGQESFPRWMPDGSLTFMDQEMVKGAIRGVFRTRPDGRGNWSAPRPLLPPGAVGNAAVTEDLRLIYRRNEAIEIVASGSGEPAVLYRPTGTDAPRRGRLEVSENGQSYYTKTHDSEGRASFWSFPVAGGPPTMLVRFDDLTRPSGRWDFYAAAGRFFFTIEDYRSNVWIADVTER